MKETNFKLALPFAIALFFLSPYVLFLRIFDFSLKIAWGDLAWALRNSITQSTLAASCVVILSVVMSWGVLQLPTSLQKILKHLLIVPQVFPVFYSILIAFSVLNPFPMGTVGLVFIYTVINLGFGVIYITSATEQKLGRMAVVSEVYGLKPITFYKSIYFHLLKADLLQLFFLIFIFCFSSFSIPLIAGGGRGSNLEVLIYEKIFIEQNWSMAFSLSFFQAVFMFLLSYFLLRTKNYESSIEFLSHRYLKSKLGLLLILAYLLLYFGGYFTGLIQSFAYAEFFKDFVPDLIESTRDSLHILALYLIFNLAMLVIWVYDYVARKKFNIALHLLSASTVVVGFVFYLSFPTTKDFDLIKIISAMSILVFPVLFKMFLQKPVQNLQSQIVSAEVYGLSRAQILIEIIWRQLQPQFYLWCLFLVIWFLSDYAILKSLGVQTLTLGLVSESFLSSYRLPLSYLMSLYILICSLIVMGLIYILTKVGYGTYKKFAP